MLEYYFTSGRTGEELPRARVTARYLAAHLRHSIDNHNRTIGEETPFEMNGHAFAALLRTLNVPGPKADLDQSVVVQFNTTEFKGVRGRIGFREVLRQMIRKPEFASQITEV